MNDSPPEDNLFPEDNLPKEGIEKLSKLSPETILLLQELAKDSPQMKKIIAAKFIPEDPSNKEPKEIPFIPHLDKLKPIIDEMIVDRQDCLFLFEDFKPWAEETLRCQLYRIASHLARYGGKEYKKFRNEVTIKTIKDKGMIITFLQKIPTFKATKLTQAESEKLIGICEEITKEADEVKGLDYEAVQKAVMEFLETSKPDEKKTITEINLNIADIADLETMVYGCEDFLFLFEAREVVMKNKRVTK